MDETDGPSDSEIPFGLPSDTKDDMQNIGMDVPDFINKLREAARPLLSLSKGVPSPTKQLKENGMDRPKESRAKKRLFRGRQEPPNGVIERRYGYIPNPRWGKPAPSGYGRQFVPKGVGDGDRSGIPGVVFREGQPEVTAEDGSFQDQDFPQLGIPANESRVQSSAELSQQGNQSKSGKLLQGQGSHSGRRTNLLDDSGRSHALGRRSASPITSTPVRWGDSSLQLSSPGLGHSSLESTYFSAVESVGDSPGPVDNSVQSVGSNSGLDRSATSNHGRSFASNTSSRRHSRKLAPSPLASATIDLRVSEKMSDQASFTGACLQSVRTGESWSDIARVSSSPPVTDPGTRSKELPRKEALTHLSEAVGSHSAVKWSQVLKTQSPVVSGSCKRKEEVKNRTLTSSSNLEAWPAASDSSLSPRCGSAKPAWGKLVEGVTPQASSPQPDIVLSSMPNGLPSPIEQHRDTVPYPCKHSPHTGSVNNIAMPHSSSETKVFPSHYSEKVEKAPKKPRQKKARPPGGSAPGSVSNERMSSSPRSSPVPWSQREKKQNSRPKSGPKGPTASHLTLENFLTPQKPHGKRNGLKNDKKDILMLESRFVEHIAANPTSPPKKVRPSPIKRASSCKRETSGGQVDLAAGGDAATVLGEDCKQLETLQEYIKTQSRYENDTDAKVKQQPSQGRLIFSMSKYLRDNPAQAGDAFKEENEDEDEYPDLSESKEVQNFWDVRAALPCDQVCFG
ncbi:hypothetical protein PoB_006195200 [Plakobranchus ocellatus]|uniref:Uncharacterized protein n=1 Tax=Plakobranchus ocellatus TaxID=259542 RepID=A0AAV4CU65_9GAST|nr:hypothetical protein PoB_006195200 [Plakobranchus ocellatus]